jgi:hypothetical protein
VELASGRYTMASRRRLVLAVALCLLHQSHVSAPSLHRRRPRARGQRACTRTGRGRGLSRPKCQAQVCASRPGGACGDAEAHACRDSTSPVSRRARSRTARLSR